MAQYAKYVTEEKKIAPLQVSDDFTRSKDYYSKVNIGITTSFSISPTYMVNVEERLDEFT